MDWVEFKNQEPPDEVKFYLVRNDKGEEFECEWFEGDYFECCSGGHWHCHETGIEIKNITNWKEL